MPGQLQQGVALFVRLDNGRYAVYQCKQYRKLDGHQLKKLVGLFLAGEWAAKSEQFVLCTSAELNSVVTQDAFNELQTKLAVRDIHFEKWDRAQLQRQVKAHLAIVYEFFGAAWVQYFNGEEA